MAVETTFVLIKPDGVAQGLCDQIKQIIIDHGFEIIREEASTPDKAKIKRHLDWGPEWRPSHGRRVLQMCAACGIDIQDTFMAGMDINQIGEAFEGFIIDYNAQGPVVAMLVRGEDAIARVNKLSGATMPYDAEPWTIRGQLGDDRFENCVWGQRAPYNIVHTADSVKEAVHQISVWFPDFYQ